MEICSAATPEYKEDILENIDFVVTWGDGNDSDWQREKDGGRIRTGGKSTTQVGIVTGIFCATGSDLSETMDGYVKYKDFIFCRDKINEEWHKKLPESSIFELEN